MLPCGAEFAQVELKQDDNMKVSVIFQVPSTAWTVQITDVYEFETEVWVVARLSTSSEVGLTIISTVSDSVTIPDTSKDVKYFILGKTWT